MTFKQAERTAVDGAVSVRHNEKGEFIVSVTHDGFTHTLVMSEYNAARLLGTLSIMLEAPLAKAVQKEIKL